MDDSYLSGSAKNFQKMRLNNHDAWTSSPTMDSDEYVQVTLRPYGRTVTALAFQGYTNWVITFILRTSEDGTEWHDYNVHGETKVLNVLLLNSEK